jgi:hypothetical protein
MMAYMFVVGHCYGCDRTFTFNAELVPSVPILPDGRVGHGGDRKPICQHCVIRANGHRRLRGLPEWDVPEGAYEAAEVP